MMGTRTPKFRRQSTILGTAAAAFSVLTVTRTNSEPALASAITWLTVEVTSSVSVLVMDWTTIGSLPPTFTPAISTLGVARRGLAVMLIPSPGKTLSRKARKENQRNLFFAFF